MCKVTIESSIFLKVFVNEIPNISVLKGENEIITFIY
jgi:hypothetical protein